MFASGGILLLDESASLPKIGGIVLAIVSVLSLLNLRAVREGGAARRDKRPPDFRKFAK